MFLYENLIYTLTAVDSFNKNLVKGVIGHITEFVSGQNAMVKFIDSDGTEATFELTENEKKHTVKPVSFDLSISKSKEIQHFESN